MNVGYATLSIIPSAKGFGSALSGEVSGPLSSAGTAAGAGFMGGFRGRAIIAAAAAGAAIAASIGRGLYEVGDIFDDVNNTIQIGTGATGQALDGLADSARSVGTTVPASFGDASEAVTSLNTLTGATGESLESMTSAVLDASRMLGEDGVTNATAFGQALQQFQRPAEDGADVLDSLFVATQDYGLGLGDVINQLTEYGSVLQNAGFSMEESAALFGQLNTAGISVSRVMPGLNMAFRNWASEGKNTQEELGRVVERIANAEDGTRALAIATDAFGAEGAQRLTTAVRSGAFSLDDLSSALSGADGAIANTSAETRKFGDSWQIFKNRVLDALEPLGTAVFDGLNNAMAAVADSPLLGRIADGIAGIAEFAGTAFQRIGDFISGLFTGGGGGAIGQLADAFGRLRDAGAGLLEAVQPALDALIPRLQQLWSVVGPAVTGGLQGLLNNVVGVVTGVIDVITGLVNFVSSVFRGDWQGAWDAIKQIVSGAVRAIWNLIQLWIVGRVVGIARGALRFLGSLFGSAWRGISSTVSGFVRNIATAISNFVSQMISRVTSGLGSVRSIFSSVWSAVRSLVSSAWSSLVSTVRSGVSNVVSFVRELPGRARSALGNIGSTLVSAGRNLIQGFMNGIRAAAAGLAETVLAPIRNAVDGVRNFLGIRSPSRLFMEIGGFTGEGMAIGLERSAPRIEKASDALIPKAPQVSAPRIRNGGVMGAMAATAGGAPLVGSLTLQSREDVRDDMEEVNFQLRRIARGGVNA